MKRKLLIIFLGLLSTAYSQNNKVIYPHHVFWHKTDINEIFPNKWGAGLDFVYRTKNELNTGSMFNAHLRTSIRPWVHYQFSEYARLSLSPIGYMHTNEYIGKPEDITRPSYNEWRTTLQFFHHNKSDNGKWMHTWRYRYELRWQEQSANNNYRFFTRFRMRYRLRYMITGNDFYENNTLYAAASNEIGLNLGKNVVWNTFNQNRLYLGVGYRFLQTARAELRYVNRFRTRGATGFEFDHGRGLMVSFYIDQITGLGKEKNPQVRFVD